MTTHLTINLIADKSVAGAPEGFTAAVQKAAAMIEQVVLNPITVNITYGWGTIRDVADASLTNGNGGSIGGAQNGFGVDYQTLVGLLNASATSSNDYSAYTNLPPNTLPFPVSQTNFFVSSAQEKALNYYSGVPGIVDGSIGFGTASTSQFWVTEALHEIAHAMGRISITAGSTNPTIMDLYRYGSPGVYQWTGGQSSYFSLDRGATSIAAFSRISDDADWSNSPLTPGDPFNYVVGNISTLTAKDIEMLDVLGFNTVAVVPSLAHLGSLTVNYNTTAVIPESQLQFDDPLSPHWELTYTITAAPLHGVLLRSGKVTSSFTQADIDGGGIRYKEIASVSPSDSFTFTVTDTAGDTTGPQQFNIQINQPDLTPPSLISDSSASVRFGGTVAILASRLDFDDNVSAHGQELYTLLAAPSDGVLLKNRSSVTSFTQADIDNRLITYTQTANLTAAGTDSFSFKVTDAAGNSTSPTSFHINISATAPLPKAPDDLNLDGESDIAWRNVGGDFTVWNSHVASTQFSAADIGFVSADWQIAGFGDFSAAGGSSVLWRNSNGQVVTWNSSSASPESFAGNGGAAYSVTTDWQVAGVGDLNGDGLSDIVWRNTAGYVDFWDANAGAGAASFSAQPVVFVSIDWQIQAVGDFNGVGKAGMLWRNANSNDINIWNANAGSGGLYATDLGYLSSDWKFAGVGDFSGDGRQDILWRNSNGEVALWTPTANASSYASVDLGFVSTDWQIQQVGDFNGDGKSDILWRNAASQDVTLWYSKPGAGETFSAVDLGYVSADWRIVAK